MDGINITIMLSCGINPRQKTGNKELCNSIETGFFVEYKNRELGTDPISVGPEIIKDTQGSDQFCKQTKKWCKKRLIASIISKTNILVRVQNTIPKAKQT